MATHVDKSDELYSVYKIKAEIYTSMREQRDKDAKCLSSIRQKVNDFMLRAPAAKMEIKFELDEFDDMQQGQRVLKCLCDEALQKGFECKRLLEEQENSRNETVIVGPQIIISVPSYLN